MSEANESFLDIVVQALDRLRQASEDHGHTMLASMIALAISEAQDDLRTQALECERFARFRAGRYRPCRPPPSDAVAVAPVAG
jgi:hypothetical protein